MRKMKFFIRLLSSVSMTVGLLLPVQAANFETNCLSAANAAANNPLSGFNCTANDATVSDFRITWIGDGCINNADTALVKMAVRVGKSTSASSANIGVFINTVGGTSAIDEAQSSTCLHEALMPIVTGTETANYSSGIGPYLDLDNDGTDICGDVDQKSGDPVPVGSDGKKLYNWERQIVYGTTTNEAIFDVACADNDGNGYVDFAWVSAWDHDQGSCTTIEQTVADTKAKCSA
ncbi:MAG: hypothetical protein U9R27_04615, partial [Campylobacterota bacterium]|nr:hypothetical protein [Campylobacterota bacterium]